MNKKDDIYLMRCMSLAELEEYERGNILINKSRHRGQATNAVGFCFFPVSAQSDTVAQRIRYLAGIVSLEAVAVFRSKKKRFRKACGQYRNYKKDADSLRRLELSGYGETCQKTEFCTETYSNKTMDLIAVGVPYWNGVGWSVIWVKGEEEVKKAEGV